MRDTNIAVRLAMTSDVIAISALMCRTLAVSNAPDYPPDIISRLIAHHDRDHVAAMLAVRTVFCAEHDGRVVGTVALEGDQLRALFVEPDRQGSGIGTRLVAHVESHAAAIGVKTIRLQTSITALTFYAAHGYAIEKVVDREEGPVTIMRKHLACAG